MTVLSRQLARKLTLSLLPMALTLTGACGDDDTTGDDGGSAGAPSKPGGHTDKDAGAEDHDAGSGSVSSKFSFFVSSQTNKTGDLGGLKKADERCAALAKAVGAGAHTWHAYLSTEHGGSDDDAALGGPIDARDRIGNGPWYNVKGDLIAADLESLHKRKGDAALFLTEKGDKVNGQWTGSPAPVEHDILTGSNADGTLLPGKTCDDWTSDSANQSAEVGHSDGLGPNQATDGTYTVWNAAHENGGCNDTAPRGGAGRIYCFVAD
jgi:hypothetical protein